MHYAPYETTSRLASSGANQQYSAQQAKTPSMGRACSGAAGGDHGGVCKGAGIRLRPQIGNAPPLNAPNAAEEAIPFLIAAEREAARRGDRAMLAQLWAVDALIIDGRGTTDPSDDYHWPGRAAILDRYVLAVFPNPPPPLDGVDALEIMVAGTEAVAVNGGDHWRFVHEDGRWWISELVYSRP